MDVQQSCPQCGSSRTMPVPDSDLFLCYSCKHEFTPDREAAFLRIFLSYGHDDHAALAERLKHDLRRRGHEVWFDVERLAPGRNWEADIEEGLNWLSQEASRGRVILLMTPHSVRRPDGYCLNEVARALERRVMIVPVMVVWSEPPLSICRVQWLDMQDCVPIDDRQEKYEAKFARLTAALERNRLEFTGSQSRLLELLKPLPFDADIAYHLDRFTGRRWVFDQIDDWLRNSGASRVFWITGKPGVGKTAIAAWLCYHKREVAAIHLCRHGHTQKADPRHCVLSIVYQLSSQLPDYEARLNALNLELLVSESNARTLFDACIVQPMTQIPRPDRTIVVLIDALDEATENGRNELASFLATEFTRTPNWLRLIITSRPDPEVTHPLQGLTPYVLDSSSSENEQDLREYLRRELAGVSEGREVPPAAIDLIVHRSEGVFLYVRWVCDELHQHRLALERLADFPQGLGEVYAQFFDRQFPLARDNASGKRVSDPERIERFKTKTRPVMEAIVAAQEPLPLNLLASLFAWNEYDQTEFRRSLGSVFSIEDGRVRPFHQSVVQWLTNADKSGSYFVSVKQGHAQLAGLCWGKHQQHPYDGHAGQSYFSRHLVIHLVRAEQWPELKQYCSQLQQWIDELKNSDRELSVLLETWARLSRVIGETLLLMEIFRTLARRFILLGAPGICIEICSAALLHGNDDIGFRELHGLALGRAGDSEQARQVLDAIRDEGKANDETIGILARTYMDLALTATDKSTRHRLLQKSCELYGEAFHRTGSVWSGIVLATLAQLSGDAARARATALQVREMCLETLGDKPDNEDCYWLLSTLGQSSLILQDADAAALYYRRAFAGASSRLGDLTATRRSARLLLEHQRGNPSVLDEWLPIPKVVAFSGFRSELSALSSTRHSPEGIQAIDHFIRSWMSQQEALIIVISVSHVLDVLLLENVLVMNGEITIVLPCGQIVLESGDEQERSMWSKRLEHVVARVSRVVVPPTFRNVTQTISVRYAELLAHGLASIRAHDLETDMLELRVGTGNGKSVACAGTGSMGGSSDSATAAFERDLSTSSESSFISLRLTPAAPQLSGLLWEAGGVHQRAMILAAVIATADGLENSLNARVAHEFNQNVSELLKRCKDPVAVEQVSALKFRVVFTSLRDAGCFALDLCGFIRAATREKRGTTGNPKLRIFIHAGLVATESNATADQLKSIADEFLPAESDLRTPLEQVYASETFAALAAAEGIADFSCRFVTNLDWSKARGSIPTYLVRHAADSMLSTGE